MKQPAILGLPVLVTAMNLDQLLECLRHFMQALVNSFDLVAITIITIGVVVSNTDSSLAADSIQLPPEFLVFIPLLLAPQCSYFAIEPVIRSQRYFT